MAHPEPEERGSLLDAAGDLARRAFRDDVSRDHAAVERERLRLAVMRGSKRGSRTVAYLTAAAALVAVTAALLYVFVERRLDYVVKSAAGSEDGYLAATATVPADAHFSDGTDVTVTPGSRARIASVDRHGARIALEHGRARLHVIHRPGAHWSVDAGPFSIAVTGTEFDVDWAGSDGRFSVDLHVGSVTVRGPLAEGGIALRAGQRLVVNVPERQLRIEEGRAGNPMAESAVAPTTAVVTTPPATEPTDVTEEPGDAAPPARPRRVVESPAASAPPASWSARVAAGDFGSVLTEAESRGIDATLGQATLGDLVALSDAARYKGKSDLAQRALGTIRSRFPASTDAKNAVFHLGRLAEGRGALTEALSYYDRYLAESNHGAFAAEAFGRKLVVTRKAAGEEKAKSVARDYLARFPSGPYAATAKELLGSR